jgi:hypothetical protein
MSIRFSVRFPVRHQSTPILRVHETVKKFDFSGITKFREGFFYRQQGNIESDGKSDATKLSVKMPRLSCRTEDRFSTRFVWNRRENRIGKRADGPKYFSPRNWFIRQLVANGSPKAKLFSSSLQTNTIGTKGELKQQQSFRYPDKKTRKTYGSIGAVRIKLI